MKKNICLIVIASCMMTFPYLQAQHDPHLVAAGKLFQQRCVNCHQPPDVSLPTDRAWLDQINRTA